MVYNPVNDSIYASVESIGPLAHTVTTINPHTGAIEASAAVGYYPGHLALSDDGQFLYVAIDGSGLITRFNIAAAVPDLSFPAGVDKYDGTLFAGDIQVLPGNPHAIAVSRRFDPRTSPPFQGVAIFDDGTPRPNVTSHLSSPATNVIRFAGSPSVLYGLDTEDTGAYFVTLSVDESGCAYKNSTSIFSDGRIPSDYITRIDIVDGLMYTIFGQVYDPVAMMLATPFSPGCIGGGCGCVVPDPQAGKVFFLTGDAAGRDVLEIFDQHTFAQVGSIAIPDIYFSDTFTTVCLRYGEKGFAFAATERLPENAREDYVVLMELP